MTDRLIERIARGPLLLDAAMGTRLIASGLELAIDDPCQWNLTRPEVVSQIHQSDIAAGAEVLFTNTFGANRIWLTRYGNAAEVGSINAEAVRLARQAAGPDRFVLGSIGPSAAQTIREQADALLAAGADGLVLETYQYEQAVAALRFLKGIGRPVLVGLLTWPEAITDVAFRLIDLGATVVGANCCSNLSHLERLIDELVAAGESLWLKPSTGFPESDHLTLADFARLAQRLKAAGTGLLGGCCGTTDAHLRAIRAAWDQP